LQAGRPLRSTAEPQKLNKTAKRYAPLKHPRRLFS
jgi:hypothetical protein